MSTLGVIIVAVVLIGLLILLMFFHYNNREVSLRKAAEAQRRKIEAVHDKMWKVIQQKADVSEKYRETFEKVYPEIIGGRYSKGGETMKWIQEANPDFDTSLYAELMESIEVQREYFNNTQTRMIDIIREHGTLLVSYPAKWFLGKRPQISYEVISSTKSKTVMKTGVDDDIEIFK